MKNEIYYWVAFIVIILAAALYARYYYKPGINIGLSLGSAGGQLYQYQKSSYNLTVTNYGSAVRDFEVGIFINGNLSSAYNITLGAGKATVIQLSHTFAIPGPYNVSAIGDPADLYNVVDRGMARTSAFFSVLAPTAPSPAAMLPANGTSTYGGNMTGTGYSVATYLRGNYSMNQFGISDIASVNSYFYPLLNQTGSYVANISYAGADYQSGRIVSVWIAGYLAPGVFAAAAQGKGLNFNFENIGGENVTVVKLDNFTTLCGWYQAGWLVSLSYEGGNCTGKVGGVASKPQVNELAGLVPKPGNSTEVGAFSYVSSSSSRFGRIDLLGYGALVYSVLWNGGPSSSICYGVIDTVNGTNYCSTYLLPNKGAAPNFSLVRTSAYLGAYNESELAFVNTSRLFKQVSYNIALLKSFNATGKSLEFTSGLSNTCGFSAGFGCSNAAFGNSNLTIRILNRLNSTVKLNSVACYEGAVTKYLELNRSLGTNSSMNATVECYDNGAAITGIPLGLNLNLALNYSIDGNSLSTTGKATII